MNSNKISIISRLQGLITRLESTTSPDVLNFVYGELDRIEKYIRQLDEREASKQLANLLAELSAEFHKELSFFGLDLKNLNTIIDPPTLAETLTLLKTHLFEFKELSVPCTSLDKERARRSSLQAVEDKVIELKNQIGSAPPSVNEDIENDKKLENDDAIETDNVCKIDAKETIDIPTESQQKDKPSANPSKRIAQAPLTATIILNGSKSPQDNSSQQRFTASSIGMLNKKDNFSLSKRIEKRPPGALTKISQKKADYSKSKPDIFDDILGNAKTQIGLAKPSEEAASGRSQNSQEETVADKASVESYAQSAPKSETLVDSKSGADDDEFERNAEGHPSWSHMQLTDASQEETQAIECEPEFPDELHETAQPLHTSTIPQNTVFAESQSPPSALEPEPVNQLLWQLISKGELSLAYWLCVQRELSGTDNYISSDLVKAAQTSLWLKVDSTNYVQDLLELSQTSTNSSDYGNEVYRATKLIALGTALKPSIIAPECGMIAWLDSQTGLKHLDELIELTKTFATLGLPITSEDLDPQAKPLEATANFHSQKISTWLQKEAPHKKTLFWRSSAIWKRLVETNGELWKIVSPAALNRKAEVRTVKEKIALWRQKSHLSVVFDTLDKGSDEMPAAARDQLYRFVNEACDQVQQWCQIVEREIANNSRSGWIKEQIHELKSNLVEPISEAVKEISDLSATDAALCIKASCSYLLGAISDFAKLMGIGLQLDSSRCFIDYLPVGETLSEALANKLLLYPELALDNDGKPTHKDLALLVNLLDTTTVREPNVEMVKKWFEKEDYRFASRLFSFASIDDTDLGALKSLYEISLDSSRKLLRESKKRLLTEIERCVVDGIIEEERSEYLGRAEAVDFHTCLNVSVAKQELSSISNGLHVARQARLSYLKKLYLEQLELAKQLELTVPAIFIKTIEDSFEQKDTRVIDELLSNLPNYLESGSSVQTHWPEVSLVAHSMEEFLKIAPKICDYLKERASLKAIAGDFRSNHLRVGIYPEPLAPNHREQIANALETWTDLKKSRSAAPRNNQSILTLLQFLGLVDNPDIAYVTSSSLGPVNLISVSTIAETCAPIPQVGSQSAGKYDVVCYWDRPTVDSLSALSKSRRQPSTPILVIFFGSMTIAEKLSLVKGLPEADFATLVLDETLLLFLAKQEQNRLATFFACSLPFTRVNPYTPFKAGNVPPEVFFGRQEMAAEIKKANGTCLIYGGRQLGKSALLHHVQRSMMRPEDNRFCWVEDIKPIGDPLNNFDPNTIWHRLRDRFKEADLISQKVWSDEPDKIYKLLRDAMALDERSVLVLFDESDNFLDADSSRNFQVVDRLRTLMQETDRRFKVVFAGLHNVQRFQGIPNQPLAHFGVPLCVGPLEPAAAEQLIRSPMESLGFQFADNAAALRILSYTNYHPGLIQLFCQELLKTLNANQPNTLPFVVCADDVERVYRNPQIRENIRERFEWTLALDTRYQAVALAMIVDQLSTNESFGHPYSAGELLPLCRSWWSHGFNDVTTDLFRGLLDEMCGLGVLVRNAQGLYRLRSPNLVRLMGREKDLEIRLLEIATRPSEIKFDADSHHALISQRDKSYSPLTNQQERLMNSARFGVVLVWGSEALDIRRIPGAFPQFVSGDAANSVFEIPDIAIKDPEESKAWLKSLLKLPGERILCYRHLGETDENLDTLVNSSIDFCRSQRARNKWIRIIYLFGPAATWNWLQIAKSRRDKLENECDISINIRPWNILGITQRLIFEQKLHLPDVCDKVIEATGGWPILINELMQRCANTDDPRPAALTLMNDISKNSRFQQQVQTSFGLRPQSNNFAIWDLIQREKEVPDDLVEPLLPEISKQDCSRALEYLERICLLKKSGNLYRCDPIADALFSPHLQEVL